MNETTQRDFRAGDILFREGDASDSVWRLLSGRIEIERAVGGRQISLGQVNPGEFFGEMGVIEKRTRIATARAESDGRAELFSVDHFYAHISSDSSAALELILRLSIRLRKVDDDLVRLGAGEPRVHVPRVVRPVVIDVPVPGDTLLTIVPHGKELQAHIGDGPVAMSRLPFVVGRQTDGNETPPNHVNQLSLKDASPYRLSRNHFLIDRVEDRLVVRDLNSMLGTIVNGNPIGRHFGSDKAWLRPGGNMIIAGGRDSPFQFEVNVG
jgi:CRP/FNR family cyclic AMP-dependent transcriptional regulator